MAFLRQVIKTKVVSNHNWDSLVMSRLHQDTPVSSSIVTPGSWRTFESYWYSIALSSQCSSDLWLQYWYSGYKCSGNDEIFQICFTLCQVREISLYTVAAVVYCARIVLAVTNLNEIPCCLEKQPEEGRRRRREAPLAWWGDWGRRRSGGSWDLLTTFPGQFSLMGSVFTTNTSLLLIWSSGFGVT